ncbi:hypothetical protein EYF80_043091 [Liparis tanakae]|uniref:Uncharacterized protein n=1 Tax=Liparis tanakae TaxID=230148 RepID=A0A4Z2G195_9TELE|nr:hypothetical protein EYF80_043091 [Liparis tanakae]
MPVNCECTAHRDPATRGLLGPCAPSLLCATPDKNTASFDLQRALTARCAQRSVGQSARPLSASRPIGQREAPRESSGAGASVPVPLATPSPRRGTCGAFEDPRFPSISVTFNPSEGYLYADSRSPSSGESV